MKIKIKEDNSKMQSPKESIKVETLVRDTVIPKVLFLEAGKVADMDLVEALFCSFQTFLESEELVVKVHVGQKNLLDAIRSFFTFSKRSATRIHFTDDGMSLSTQTGIQNVNLLDGYFTPAFSDNGTETFLLPTNSSLVNFAHPTGHTFTGYSGAINNIGLGLINFPQREVLHRLAGVLHIETLKCSGCNDIQTELCKANCYRKAIEIVKNEGGKVEVLVNSEKCNYCAHCLICPNHVFSFSEGTLDRFVVLLAHTAKDILGKFKAALHINYAMDITPFCDCMQSVSHDKPVNVGVLASEDIVALERATIDLIKQKSDGDDVIDINDAQKLVQTAEQAGLGRVKYDMVEL